MLLEEDGNVHEKEDGDILYCSCQEENLKNETPCNYNMIRINLMVERTYPPGVSLRIPIVDSASLSPFANGAPYPFGRLRTGPSAGSG